MPRPVARRSPNRPAGTRADPFRLKFSARPIPKRVSQAQDFICLIALNCSTEGCVCAVHPGKIEAGHSQDLPQFSLCLTARAIAQHLQDARNAEW